MRPSIARGDVGVRNSGGTVSNGGALARIGERAQALEQLVVVDALAAVERVEDQATRRAPAGHADEEVSGKPTPSNGTPTRVPTSISTVDRVIGMPVRRVRTSFRKLFRTS